MRPVGGDDDSDDRVSGSAREDDERVIPFVRPVSIDQPVREPWQRPGFVINDRNLAACFIDKRGVDFRYSRQRRVWRAFGGAGWQDDALLTLHGSVGELMDEVGAVAAKRIKDRIRIGSYAMQSAIEAKLRALLAIDESIFDARPWLSNMTEGTMDLKYKGAPLVMRKHDRNDYLTRMTGASPFGECPLWLEFIDQVTVGDKALAAYLQRLFGSALTGVRTDQILAYLYGTGGNGKGAMMQTLLHVFGSYGVTVSSEVFAASPFTRHSEELMPLRGARLIVASETESGHSWNESRIKQLTGGDKIRARNMRENSIEFEISGLICILANHQLELANVDDAIKRRLHMVPFNAKFAGEAVDPMIVDKLKREAGGILKWLIEGCRLWQLDGLQPPEAVITATDEYIGGEDHVREFADEHLVTHVLATMVTKTSDIYAAWKKFAEARGYKVGNINDLSRNLTRLGFEKNKSHKKGRAFARVALKE